MYRFHKATPYRGADNEYHFCYVVINKVNGKLYFGKRSTRTLKDGYLGSGIGISRALNKYSSDNFERIELAFCDSSSDAYDLESVLIDEELVRRQDNYNGKPGGRGASKGEMNHMYGRRGDKHPNFGKDFAWVERKPLSEQSLENIAAPKRGKISVKYPDGTNALLYKDIPKKPKKMKALNQVCPSCGVELGPGKLNKHIGSRRCLARKRKEVQNARIGISEG